MRKFLLALATVSVAAACGDHESGHAIHWDYGDEAGPAQWSTLSPDFALCDEGKAQSPIDLSVAVANDERLDVRRNFQPVSVHVSYQESTVNLLDNGHTIQVSFEDGNTVDVGDKQFALIQYHFHAPSEHTMNGEHFPMEAHFVHAAASGELAVAGIFIEQGEHNPAFDPVWNILPTEPGESRVLEGQDVDLDALVPTGSRTYRYMGSLTTPPCSEGVNWFVREAPIALSAEQIAAFTDIFNHNNRPVQSLNDRELVIDTPSYIE